MSRCAEGLEHIAPSGIFRRAASVALVDDDEVEDDENDDDVDYEDDEDDEDDDEDGYGPF